MVVPLRIFKGECSKQHFQTAVRNYISSSHKNKRNSRKPTQTRTFNKKHSHFSTLIDNSFSAISDNHPKVLKHVRNNKRKTSATTDSTKLFNSKSYVLKDNFSLDVPQSTATCNVFVLEKPFLKYSFQQLFDLYPSECCDSMHVMNDYVPVVHFKSKTSFTQTQKEWSYLSKGT